MSGYTLLTVEQLAARHPALTAAAIRWQIFCARENGLDAAGAIRRVGRRVYIIAERYDEWIDAHGTPPAERAAPEARR